MDFAAEDPRIGTILNERYRIIERLASGGMAVVYRGERLELERPVAIKFLHEVILQYPKFKERFEAEAKAMSKLSHPYCVSVIDFGLDRAPYIVMDFIEGQTLKSLLASELISLNRALRIVKQILAGIAHAHSQGVIHRDIKPENIMVHDAVGVGETIRIFDFGLAKLTDMAGTTQSGAAPSIVAGTPSYMSPEQSRGIAVDHKTDLYSISVILFELLTGRKPFVHDDFVEMLRMHRDEAPPKLHEVAGLGVFSSELEAVVAKGLSKDPNDRFKTAEEFSLAIETTPEGIIASSERDSVLDPQGKTLPIGTQSIFNDNRLSADSQKQANSLPSVLPNIGNEQKDKASANKTKSYKKNKTVAVFLLTTVATVLLVNFFRSSSSETNSVEHNPVNLQKEKSDKKQPGYSSDFSDNKKNLISSESQQAEDTDLSKEEIVAEIEIKTVKDALQVIKEGDKERAILGLRKLRREQTQNAYIVFLLGDLYFQKEWWSDAMDHYAEAIRLDSSYKKRASIHRDLIIALGSEKTYRKASLVLHKSVGNPALPALRRASKRDENPAIRKRAQAVISRIQGR